MLYDLMKALANSIEGCEGDFAISEDLLKGLLFMANKKKLNIKVDAVDLGGKLYKIGCKVYYDVVKEIKEEDKNILESVVDMHIENLIPHKK